MTTSTVNIHGMVGTKPLRTSISMEQMFSRYIFHVLSPPFFLSYQSLPFPVKKIRTLV